MDEWAEHEHINPMVDRRRLEDAQKAGLRGKQKKGKRGENVIVVLCDSDLATSFFFFVSLPLMQPD